MIYCVSDTLNYLSRHGMTVAIDDSRSGFSSLSYLHTLLFDTIKINRNFVADMLTDPKSESVIASVVVLAHEFNIPLIARTLRSGQSANTFLRWDARRDRADGYAARHF